MAKAFLRANTEVTLDGAPYLIERQCKDGVWVLRHQRTERPLEHKTEELFDAYVAGTLVFRDRALGSITAPRRSGHAPKIRQQRDIRKTDTAAAKVRMAYVRATRGLPTTQASYEQAIAGVWRSLGLSAKKPSWTSVYRWVRTYTESGETPVALLESHEEKGNRKRRYSPEVLEICQETIESVYLCEERPSVEHTVDIAQAKTRAANALVPKSLQLAMPTRRLIQRMIDEIPAYDRHVARLGHESARKTFRSVLHHRLTEAPLQRAEMDHTRIDLFAIDDVYGLPLGRPWLTILIDDYTRCILGFCLSFEPPSCATVARCLRNAFTPKTGLRTEYPDLKNDWSAFGVVSELVMDGGLEFHSQELENICFELDIEQHFSPRKTAWFKGKVERLQGTLNRGIAVQTPGKTFGSILEREDYDPKKHAVVSMSALRHLVIRWIVDVYHQKPHSALGCSPAQKWVNSINAEDIPLMPDPLRLDAILGGTASRVLSHKGIECAGLLYNSPELTALRQQLGDRMQVDVRINRSDLGSVIVLHPDRGTPYRVPCLRPDYASGLTEWQHNVCKRYTRDVRKSDPTVDDWLDSLYEISDIVAKEMKLGKRKGVTRERIARWSEGKQALDTVDTYDTEPLIHTPAPVLKPVTPKAAKQARSPSKIKAQASRGSLDKVVEASGPAPAVSELDVPSVARKRFTPVFEERKLLLAPDESSLLGGPSHE